MVPKLHSNPLCPQHLETAFQKAGLARSLHCSHSFIIFQSLSPPPHLSRTAEASDPGHSLSLSPPSSQEMLASSLQPLPQGTSPVPALPSWSVGGFPHPSVLRVQLHLLHHCLLLAVRVFAYCLSSHPLCFSSCCTPAPRAVLRWSKHNKCLFEH